MGADRVALGSNFIIRNEASQSEAIIVIEIEVSLTQNVIKNYTDLDVSPQKYERILLSARNLKVTPN